MMTDPSGLEGYSVEPHLFVVFGGTGDLTRRKLLPALRRLGSLGVLGPKRALLAIGRDPDLGDEGFREWARQVLRDAGAPSEDLSGLEDARIFYQSLPDGDAADYARLAARIEQVELHCDLPGNRAFYMALPPRVFPAAIEGLAGAGLNRGPGWTRLVVEKPFGRDLDSARELNALIHRHFSEDQVYRIDHYLGKDTVQNLLVFRFANAMFESLWNRDRIDTVQITVAEDLGIGTRAGYYDRAGALRDMVQNHVAQLLSLIGMEVPARFDAEAVRHEKIKLLQSVLAIESTDVVFGRYGPGVIDGREVPGYLDEAGVPPSSTTDTFVAMRLKIDNWRWQGVPFYLRTGKRLDRRLTQIAVKFKAPPVCLFQSMGGCETHSNVLLLTLQPDEGFALVVDVKVPGDPFRLQRIPLDFLYSQAFDGVPDAYQTLLLDVLTGDQTLFVHGDEAEASWQLFGPLLEGQAEPETYAAGSWGPTAADSLLRRRGHAWLDPVEHPQRPS